MGEMQSINDLLRGKDTLNDQACLRIIDPSLEDRFRDDLISGDSVKKYFLPTMDKWRIADCVGIPVQNVRANFFVMDPRFLPTTIYLYNISIYDAREFFSGGFDETSTVSSSSSSDSRKDLSKEKDTQLNTKLMKTLIENCPQLRQSSRGDRIGLSYDGKSSLYSSRPLELPFTLKGYIQQDRKSVV